MRCWTAASSAASRSWISVLTRSTSSWAALRRAATVFLSADSPSATMTWSPNRMADSAALGAERRDGGLGCLLRLDQLGGARPTLLLALTA